ncbi:alpha/beta fold hydrolase [Paraburkholderia sp. ZP32-5]|uniref:alpha/beta fold hydrolase n=1 Tax=Paraburkholderia sp. ZP32-5 TaxID=2883245 RepID=UPI001F46FFB8|nr:alpha/beta hydrolase [Paraburkholderia sp. ZP32-5]
MIDTIRRHVRGPAGDIAIYTQGAPDAPVVVMAHSILSSSMMWEAQAALLAARGWRVICADTRGHGASQAEASAWTMDDLAADTIAVLDALAIERAHYVGLSLGGMSGFGLGIRHADRLLSLCLCDARADAPAAFAAPWDERIELARRDGCGALAVSTTERWFGKPFVEAHPEIAARFRSTAAATSTDGFIGCARAIQKLDYLRDVTCIDVPTTLIVGANDAALPQAMEQLSTLIPEARLDVIANAGHLPNIDQPDAFNDALLRHLQRTNFHPSISGPTP